MATLYGTNATAVQVTVPSEKVPAGEFNGRVRIAFDSYTVTAAITSGDVMKFMKLPAGARVINAILSHDDLGTAGTAKLGWEASSDAVVSADDDGLIASIDLNAAANVRHTWEDAPPPGMFKKFASEVQVSLTFTATTTATGGTINCGILYVVD